MKIFFIRNVPNNLPWSLEMFPVMPVTIFPRKTMKKSCFFMYADYCRASHSNCMHCSSFAPTQWDHFWGSGRAVELLQFALYCSKSLLVSSYDPGVKYIQRISHRFDTVCTLHKTSQFYKSMCGAGTTYRNASSHIGWIYSVS